MYKHRACHAATSDSVERVFDCDVVVDVNRVHFDAVVLSVAHCVVEVHAVAGIVLDDEKHAFVGCASLDCVVDLHLGRGCEDVAANSRVKHTFADEACVCGFVTAAAAGDKADFVVVDVFLFDDFVFFNEFEFRMSRGKTVTHIVDESFGGVHYFFHNISPCNRKSENLRGFFNKTLPCACAQGSVRFIQYGLVAAFAIAAVSEIVTDLICRFDCSDNHVFGYREGHVVNGFVGDAGLCCDDLVFFFGEFFSDNFARARICHKVVQANGESHFVTEVENFVEFFFGAVFKDELADRAECDDFAVHAACVNVVNCGETVVDCVCRCKSARFEAETGKKDVGFNNLFESRSHNVAVASRVLQVLQRCTCRSREACLSFCLRRRGDLR